MKIRNRLLSLAIYAVSIGLGVLTFIYPFILPGAVGSQSMDTAHASETPLLYMLLLTLCLGVLLYEVQGEAVKSRQVALLGVLVALNSILRFIDIAIPGPGGFSPIFFLIILTGVVFGGRFGFLMGALTLFVSALITGGVGPWLPGQMFTAGWMGMSAALCRPLIDRLNLSGKKTEIWLLMAFGALWGLIFGAIMNLWAWPFIAGPADQYWTPGISLLDTLHRYGLYYLVTSLPWDLARSAGNVLLIGIFGAPCLKALRRFEQRLVFRYETPLGHEKDGQWLGEKV
ncbi:MAG: ECF transporter S component [Negativicutes bacterium]|nr:ECF transporter S component [Negativicutes bacterium]